jgi:hypothetical protein
MLNNKGIRPMTSEEASKAISDLAEKLRDHGFDFVSITLSMAANGEIYHEWGEVISEGDEAVRRGINSLLYTAYLALFETDHRD